MTSSLGCPATAAARAQSGVSRRFARADAPRRHVRARGETRSANRTKWASAEAPAPVAAVAEADPTAPAPASASTPAPARPSSHEAVWDCVEALQSDFLAIDRLIAHNSARVQRAFARQRLGPHCFQGSTGYGHGDLGRSVLDAAFAEIFEAEAALVRPQFMSGTHAIATALYACLRPGDELLCAAGHPYDTLEEVIGTRNGSGMDNIGSLADFGVTYREVPLSADGSVDIDAVVAAVGERTKVVEVQRSCGYALRPTLTVEEVGEVVRAVKTKKPDCIVVVDNCYGEFTEEREPTAVGADLCMGSLIKNGGGTIVPGGGYVAGRQDLIERCAARLSAPGLSTDAGNVNGEHLRLMFQGLWLAPQMTGEALKGGLLVAEVLRREGFRVRPVVPEGGRRVDFITSVELGDPKRMEAFCQAIQARSPVGSYITPIPGATAGYGDEVIFADGTFIDGATSELSADGPLRPPYVVYCQGGQHWTQWANVLEGCLERMRAME